MSATILIVEDNAKNRVLLRDVLQYHGYEVVEAVNGEECVRLATARRPALILLDIQMPVMDGFTALRRLRETPATRPLKVIALTSFAMAGDSARIMQAGFDGYLAKPLNTRELPAIVKGYLDAAGR